MLEARTNYGPCKKNQDYRVLSDGFDWYMVSSGGKAIFAPKWVFEKD